MSNQVTWIQALLEEIRLGVDGEEVGRGSDLRRGRGFGEDRKRSKERGSTEVRRVIFRHRCSVLGSRHCLEIVSKRVCSG